MYLRYMQNFQVYIGIYVHTIGKVEVTQHAISSAINYLTVLFARTYNLISFKFSFVLYAKHDIRTGLPNNLYTTDGIEFANFVKKSLI